MNGISINTKTVKIVLVASLVAIVAISIAGYFAAEKDERNPRDKTLERLQEKEARAKVLEKMNALYDEKEELEKSDSMTDDVRARINEIEDQLDQIDRENHSKDIPEEQLQEIMAMQEEFQEKLMESEALQYITGIGIDITSREIQIGLNSDIVNSDNIDSVVSDLEQLMPEGAKWHVVYSSTAGFAP